MKRRLAVFLLAWLVLSVGTAHAYIDPGTGSLLVQALIAGIAAGLLALKVYWNRLKALLTGRRSTPAAKTGGGGEAEP